MISSAAISEARVRQAQNATSASVIAGAVSSEAENTRWISLSFSSSSSKVTTVTSLVEFLKSASDFLSSLPVGLVPTMTMHWIA
jgi:hypothetical protein